MKRLFYYVFMFLFIFPVKFAVYPISTRIFIAFFGVLVFYTKTMYTRKFPKYFLYVFWFLFPLLSVSLFSILLNHSNDCFFIIDFPASVIVSLLGAYGVLSIFFYVYQKPTLTTFLDSILYCMLLQFCITFLMFLCKPVSAFLVSIQFLQENQLSLFLINSRLSGFGCSSFYAGYLCSFCLLLIPLIIALSEGKVNISKYVWIYCVIAVIGNMYARITLVGVFFSILLWVFINKEKIALFNKQRNKFFLILFMLLIIVVVLLFVIAFTSKLGSVLISWAFEPVMNFFSKGKFQTDSTEELSTMFLFPDNVKTWLFGDASFVDPLDSTKFYKHIDVGYLRLLYYFGIVGAFFFFVFQYQIIVSTIKLFNKNIISVFLRTFFVMVLVLNVKGLTEISGFVFLLTMWRLGNKKILC